MLIPFAISLFDVVSILILPFRFLDHISTPFNKQFSRDGDQTNIICISPTKRNVLGNEICGTALEAKTTYSQSQINMSQDFPPPPSEEELGEKEVDLFYLLLHNLRGEMEGS